MKKIKSHIIIVMIILSMFLSMKKLEAKKITDLPNVLKPDKLLVFNNNIYIVEGTTIKIFNITDGKLLRSIGKKGEGPGEFKHSPTLFGYKDKIIANSDGKIIYFSLMGDYLKEIKIQGHNARYIPVLDNFIGRKNSPDKKGNKFSQKIALYDSKLNFIEELYKGPMPGMMFLSDGDSGKQDYKIINNLIDYNVMNNKIFIADSSKGIYLKIIDKAGKLISEIKKDYKKELVNDGFKKKETAKLESQSWFKQFKDRFKIVFPKYFPAFRGFRLSDNKIYLKTYKVNNRKSEFLVLDLKGNELRKLFLPNPKPKHRLFYINNNKYIYLIENEEEEQWELHQIDLKG